MACIPTISYNDFTGDGIKTQFTITFEYINDTDVKGRSESAPPYTDIPSSDFYIEAANPQTVIFNTAPSGPFRLYRCTYDQDLEATFQAGSAVRAGDLNDNFNQLLYLAQEARAGSAGDLVDLQNQVAVKIDTISGTAPITATKPTDSSALIGISPATSSAAGSMSAADKTKLDAISDGAQPGTVTSVTGTSPINVTDGSSTPIVAISAATTSSAGSLSAADKAKLDSIQLSATQNATFVESFDSSRTKFTFAGGATAVSAWDLTISINGVIQQPFVDFTYNGLEVTFTSAPIVTSEYWVMIKGFKSPTGDWFSNITPSMVPLTSYPYGLGDSSSLQDFNNIIVSKIDALESLNIDARIAQLEAASDALDARLDAIKVAVNDSTDFDSLKTRLLAILQ